MAEPELKLPHAPIVEAVLEIDCDMPPSFSLQQLEQAARDAFRDRYPEFRTQFLHEHSIETKPGAAPRVSVRNAVQAFQFFQSDQKQLIQVRMPGYSFNRLAPYTTLDEYLPEIERTWRTFVGLATPKHVRGIRLRYINRILLPLVDGKVDLTHYLELGPRLPDEENLTFTGFLIQQTAIDRKTGNQSTTVLTTQPIEGGRLPIILDNSVGCIGSGEPAAWDWILTKILSLREFKNRIFRKTLTPECLNLFQH